MSTTKETLEFAVQEFLYHNKMLQEMIKDGADEHSIERQRDLLDYVQETIDELEAAEAMEDAKGNDGVPVW